MHKIPHQHSNVAWYNWLAVALGITIILFASAFAIMTKREEITLVIEHKHGSYVLTNQGSYGFPENKRIFINYILGFDLRRESLPKLTLGCSYRVKTVREGFGQQPLGENRVPPLNKIVKVLKRMEATEQECDVSAKSGKPVCRDDQVVDDKKRGLFIKSRDCDFETYVKNK